MKKKKEELTFGDIVAVFIPKLWIIAIVAVVCGSLMMLYSAVIKPKTYTSTTSIIVYNEASENDTSNSDITAAQNMVATYSYIIKSDFFLETIITGSDDYATEINPLPGEYGLTAQALRGAITTEQEGETEIFKVRVTMRDKEMAYAVANSIYEYCTILLPEKTPYTITVKTIDAPKLAESANSKNTLTSGVIGALVGVVASLIVIWLISVFDIVIHDKNKLEDNFDLPILGVIPSFDVPDAEVTKNA